MIQRHRCAAAVGGRWLPRVPVLALTLWLSAQSEVHGRPGGPAARAPCAAPAVRLAQAPRRFLGYSCRDDRCASHKAGFDWAERNAITTARSCVARNDLAFTEGCRVFAATAVTGEQAGFEWARQNELADPCQCAGAGERFEAGCLAYVAGFSD